MDCIEEIVPESIIPLEEVKDLFDNETLRIQTDMNKLSMKRTLTKQKLEKANNQIMYKTLNRTAKLTESDAKQSNPSSTLIGEKRRAERQSSGNDNSIATAVADAVHLHSDEGKTIDMAILDEDDDAICEEDYQRKRIILWLMKVRTGDEAEQKTREKTPVSSPKLNHGNAIVVVYDESK